MEESLVDEIPFHSLIVGPTKSGKTKYLIDLLRGPFRKAFKYIFLICPTYSINKTWENFAQGDKRFIVMDTDHDEINKSLEICHDLFYDNETEKVLVILDDCASSLDVKKRSSILSYLAYSGRHNNISLWILTQQLTSITKTFRDNSSFIINFNNHDKESNDILFKKYGSDIEDDTKKNICEILKKNRYSRIFFYMPLSIYEVQIPNI